MIHIKDLGFVLPAGIFMIIDLGCDTIRAIGLACRTVPNNILHPIDMRPERNLHFLVALKAFKVLGGDSKVPIGIWIGDAQICRNRATNCTARWSLGTCTIEGSSSRYRFRSWPRRWDSLSFWDRLCFFLWLVCLRNFWASDWKLCYWGWRHIIIGCYLSFILNDRCWASLCRNCFTFSDCRFFHSHFIGMGDLYRGS